MHRAHTVDYKLLEYMLDEYVRVGLVSEKKSGSYSLFCYTQKTVFDRSWDIWTSIARGLIIDRKARKIVATPFEKFFNFGERPDAEEVNASGGAR